MMRRTPMKRSAGRVSTPRKPMRSSGPKQHTAAESRYLAAVAARACELCRFLGWGETPCHVHHQRTGTGMMRADHYHTTGLCPEHHQGATGVHSMGRDEFEAMHGISEVRLVERTRAALAHLLPKN